MPTGIFSKVLGTISSYFQVGLGGPIWGTSSGVLEARQSNNATLTQVRAASAVGLTDVPPIGQLYQAIGVEYDGGGNALSAAGNTVVYASAPWSGTIKEWVIIGNTSGSIVIDVWKSTYAGAPPTVADTIAGSDKPSLSASQKNRDQTLTGWGNTAVTAGDMFGFHIDSVSTLTRVTLELRIQRTV